MPKESEKLPERDALCTCRRCRQSVFWRLFKIFGLAMVILLFMFIGAAAGFKQGAGHFGGKGVSFSVKKTSMRDGDSASSVSGNMMFTKAVTQDLAVPARAGMMSSGTGTVMFGKFDPNAKRVAGVVTAIDGTKITLTDNGGNLKAIYSTSETVIFSSTGEVSLSSLKVKQFVVATVVDKGNLTTAQTISFQ